MEATMEHGANEEVKEEVLETQTDESLNTESGEQLDQEGQAIPYKRFKSVIDEKNEYKGKLSEMEKQLEQLSWANHLNALIAEKPELEQQFIDLIAGKAPSGKDVDEEEELDPRDKAIKELQAQVNDLKGNISKNTEAQQKTIYASYEDDFQSKVGDAGKDAMLNSMLKMATQTVLDSEFKGWRERHIPGIIEKAYAKVQDNFDKYLNTKKKDYIDNKTRSDTPDIGKGTVGNAVDNIPIGDSEKMKQYVAEFMTGKRE